MSNETLNKNIPTGVGVIIIIIFAITAFFMVQKADAIMNGGASDIEMGL